MSIANCKFVSVWDDGIVLSSPAAYNSKNNSFEVLSTHDVDVDILVDEYLEFPDGSTLPVCKECHEGILVTTMEHSENNPMDKTLREVTRCLNCD